MNREQSQFAIAIPAYRPGYSLVDLVRSLSGKGAAAILVVDDGSGPEYQEVFARAAEVPGVQVLRHAVPRGRAAALRTAINHALCTIDALIGVVTADASALSGADDILGLGDALRAHPESLILSSNQTDGGASQGRHLRSAAARGMLRILSGPNLTKTETELRAIPAILLPRLLEPQAEGSKFEIETLIAADRMSIPIWEEFRRTGVPPGRGATGFSLDLLRLGRVVLFRDASKVLMLSALFGAVFAALLGVEVYGFRTNDLFTPDIWFPVGLKRFTRYGAEFLAFAVPLLVMAPWTFAALIASLLLVLTAISVGPQPLLATGFFLISSCALGSRLIEPWRGRRFRPSKVDMSITVHICSTLLGIGVYVFLMTFMARLPVNYPLVWAILLAIPIGADLRGVGRRLTYWMYRLRSVELRPPWERVSFALLVFILGAHWFVALMPETSADGLAMHLAIPMNIAANHRMTFEPSRYLWSVMPMGADWANSIVYLLGGEYAAHILTFAMLLAIVALLYRATRRWVTPAAAFLLAASFAATPVVQFVTGSLFVENFLVALVIGMMTALWQFGETGDKRFLYLAMVAGGTAMSTKYGALLFVGLSLPFLVREIVRHWRSLGSRPRAVCAVAFLLLLTTALPAYAIAYVETGNPIFPFLNSRIHSPLLNPSVVILDARFHIPVGWSSLYTLTFHTNRAYEGQNGSFGFQYLIVVPLAILGLLAAKGTLARSAAVVGLGGGLLILQSTANVRYLYTSMPLLLVAFAVPLGWMMSRQRWMYRVLLVYIFVSTGLNAYFLPASSYYHKDFCLRLPFSRVERENYVEEAAPVRRVTAYYNRQHPNSGILLTSGNAIAGLTGDVYENSWHQYPIAEQLRAARTPLDMLLLLRRWRVGYFLVEKLPPGDHTVPAALEALLNACAAPEYALGGFSLLRLEPDCGPPPSAPIPHDKLDPTKQIVVQPGIYDDSDPSVAFDGDWTHDSSFEGPDRHTISYSDTPGSEVSIAFRGTALTYVFTKAPNRGIAAVTIDGGAPRLVDLYSAGVVWRSRQTFCCLTSGRHRVVIRVTDTSNPKAEGRFVDLDSFVVE